MCRFFTQLALFPTHLIFISLVTLELTLLSSESTFAQQEMRTRNPEESIPFRMREDFTGNPDEISIIPALDEIVLIPTRKKEITDTSEEENPWICGAKIPITVQSMVPLWGVVIEAKEFTGPEGTLPADRLWVRTEQTGRAFQPLVGFVPLVTGDFRTPEKHVSADLQVRPAWNDPPGDYHGKLLLQPFMPEDIGYKGRPNVRSARIRENPERIQLNFTIQEYISIAIPNTELTFRANRGPGEYKSDRDLVFQVVSNARTWHVECQATPLVSENDEIPAGRLSWERIDRFGRRIDSASLNSRSTVLEGYGITSESKAILRFTLLVTMSDRPGEYRGRISLVGVGGN
jgi:hypothetical protein